MEASLLDWDSFAASWAGHDKFLLFIERWRRVKKWRNRLSPNLVKSYFCKIPLMTLSLVLVQRWMSCHTSQMRRKANLIHSSNCKFFVAKAACSNQIELYFWHKETSNRIFLFEDVFNLTTFQHLLFCWRFEKTLLKSFWIHTGRA